MKTATIITALLTFTIFAGCAVSAHGQRRDFLTQAEIDLVKENQQIDLRVAVLSGAVDRRLYVLEGTKTKRKESEEWGPLPQGTSSQLLRDIDLLIGKAISDIDDVAERNARGEFFNKAVHQLAADCKGFLPRFKNLVDLAKGDSDRGSLIGAAAQCEDVIKAADTLPKEAPKDSKKKKP